MPRSIPDQKVKYGFSAIKHIATITDDFRERSAPSNRVHNPGIAGVEEDGGRLGTAVQEHVDQLLAALSSR